MKCNILCLLVAGL